MTEGSVTERLEAASSQCIKSYNAWQNDKTDTSIRESLVESVHELRKATARLEIELAISERDMKKSKPIPIPPHRSSRRKGGQNNDNKGGSKKSSGKKGGSSGSNKRSKSSGGGSRKKGR